MNTQLFEQNQNNIRTLILENKDTNENEQRIEIGIDALVDIVNNKYKIIGWKVDTQEDFMNDGSRDNYEGKLAIKDAMTIAGKIGKVERALRIYRSPIFGSMDWHNEDSKEFPKEGEEADFKETFPKHCVAKTHGAQFIKEAQPRNPMYVNWDKDYDLGELTTDILNHEGEVIFRKDAFDVFSKDGNKHAKEVVEQLNIKNAIVYGVALEVCNNYAVEGLLQRGVKVYAVTDAMKAINEDVRSVVLESWEEKGATLITCDQLYNTLATIKRYE